MGRTYTKKVGGRSYREWTEEQMAQVLEEIKKKRISLREASKRYGIPRNSIAFRLRGGNASTSQVRKAGGQPVFSEQEEKEILSQIMALDCLPLTVSELRDFVKSYLTIKERVVPKFVDNTPGVEWARHFLKRHQTELSQHLSQSIIDCDQVVDQDNKNSLEEESGGGPIDFIEPRCELTVGEDDIL